jgi:hypothetical protein
MKFIGSGIFYKDVYNYPQLYVHEWVEDEEGSCIDVYSSLTSMEAL